MTAPSEHWVLCGGALHPRAPADALRLAVSGPHRNLQVDIEGISDKLTSQVPPCFKDLILIAAYVLAADSAIARGDGDDANLNAKWYRRFRFIIAVKLPDFWGQKHIKDLLEQTLGFVSDDSYTFEFVPAAQTEPDQLRFAASDGGPFVSWDHIDDVALFSGGLDSLTGAAEQIIAAKKNLILVSHRSATKIWRIQKDLVADLLRLSGTRGTRHAAIEVIKQDGALRVERTQRSRSFLYAAVAGTVAHLLGRHRVLLYENGIIGLNLPISRQVVGANATRTAHPKTLLGFSKILQAVSGHPLRIENPFLLDTRPEVLQRLMTSGGISMMKHSVSCAHVHKSSKMHPHCGVCSQCIDRRFAVLASGLEEHDPAEGYAVDLVRGEWDDDRHRQLLVDYVLAADRFSEYKSAEDLLADCGEANRAMPGIREQLSIGGDEAGRLVFEMHKRHGQAIERVLAEVYAKHAKEMRNGTFAPNSMPMLLLSKGVRDAEAVGGKPAGSRPVQDATSTHLFRQEGEMWTLRFDGGRAFSMKPNRGLQYLRYLLQRPGEAITALALVDLCEGRDSPRRPLSTALGFDSETIRSVRAAIRKVEQEKEEAQEFCNVDEVARCEEELEKLAAYLRAGSGPRGKARRETPEQKRARTAVSNAIDRAIKKVEARNPALASHLDDQIQRGFFLKYRNRSIGWET